MASRESRADDESGRRAADRELARRALRGDAEAQRELVRRMTPLIWSLCRRFGLPPTEAEDVSQEVFIRALDALPRFRGRCALESLAEPARSVLVAYYLGELPVMEIARVLDMPEGTVKTHLHRGRQTLRQQLRDLS
jgi:DNA-directed RNA polymerase specialized sigma24 family protein